MVNGLFLFCPNKRRDIRFQTGFAPIILEVLVLHIEIISMSVTVWHLTFLSKKEEDVGFQTKFQENTLSQNDNF